MLDAMTRADEEVCLFTAIFSAGRGADLNGLGIATDPCAEHYCRAGLGDLDVSVFFLFRLFKMSPNERKRPGSASDEGAGYGELSSGLDRKRRFSVLIMVGCGSGWTKRSTNGRAWVLLVQYPYSVIWPH